MADIPNIDDLPIGRIRTVLKRAVVDEHGCWVWQGSLNRKGYGQTSVGYRSTSSHRFVYEQLVGPIPEGLQIDHLCRNRACCNPDHLEPVTAQENALRGIGIPAENAAKTHCIRGHELPPVGSARRRDCAACAVVRLAGSTPDAGKGRGNYERKQCKNGHEYTEGSYTIHRDGTKRCRACQKATATSDARRDWFREYQREWRKRRQEQERKAS